MRRRAALLLLAIAVGASASVPPDDSTPRRALRHYIDACRDGDYAEASSVLQLPRKAALGGEGPRLARQLKFIIDRQVWIDWDAVSDEPGGDPAQGPGAVVVGVVSDGGLRVPIRLVRLVDGNWRVGEHTVSAVPQLYAQLGPGWIGGLLPPVLMETRLLEVAAWQWLGLAASLALALAAAYGLGGVALALAKRLARKTPLRWDDELVLAVSGPVRLLLGLGVLALALPRLRFAIPAQAVADQVLGSCTILAFTWVATRGVGFLADLAASRVGRDGRGEARGTATRIMVLRRVAGVGVAVLGGALVLLQFDGLRAIGTSLLASAGVAGIVVGLAAQRSIGTLLAGLQVSIAEPFRVGDVVIMEGEWGNVEEITLTYVVLRTWDLRRLVIPIGRVLDTPFQNWSRAGTQLLGTVIVHADYGVPVDRVRAEVERFVPTRKEWDGKVALLQVTDATARTVELRALVSAPDASRAWDLRCALREHLVAFLQGLEGGRYLPRVRLGTAGHPQGPAAEA